MSRCLNWIFEWANDVLRWRELAIFVYPALEVLSEGKASDSHGVCVYTVVLHQVMKDL